MSKESVEFLYKQERADPETFLLGRKIEKAEHLNTYTSAAAATKDVGGVEGLQRHSVRTELQQQATGGTMSAQEIEQQRIAIDMQAKMRDDPLFLIRKREEDDKRELLKNPLKMKRLHEMLNLVSNKKQSISSGQSVATSSKAGDQDGDNLLQQYLKILQQKNEEKAKKAAELLSDKKKRGRRSRSRSRGKRRSRSRSSSSSSSSSASSTGSLLEGYMNALKQKQSLLNKLKVEDEMAEKLEKKAQERKERQRLLPGGGGDSDEEDGGKKSGSASPSPQRRRPPPKTRPTGQLQQQKPHKQYSHEEPTSSRHKPQEGRSHRQEYDRRDNVRRRDSPDHRRDRDRYYRRRSRSSSSSSRSPSPARDARRRPPRSRSRSPVRSAAPSKGRLSPGTMQRKRDEMAAAAQQRNVERVSNVKRYEEDDRKEQEKEEQVRQQAKSSFLQAAMSDHADRTTVGERVQRNKFNVQRRGDDIVTGGAKFLKR